MTEQRTTARWAWFLFASNFSTARAKHLLVDWSAQDLTFDEVVNRLPRQARDLGLTSSEAAQLSNPGEMSVTALTWDDPRYPRGLLSLPLKLKPALLFYDGESTLLNRPIVYLTPAELESDEEREVLRELINLVLGEHFLIGVYEGSEQARVLFEEMIYTEGEALLFATAGLQARSPSDVERELVAANRLIVVSPLAPEVAHRPTWEPVLREVAAAAADRVLLTGLAAHQPAAVIGLGEQPALAVSGKAPSRPLPDNVQSTTMPADALLWLDNLLAATTDLESGADDREVTSPAPMVEPEELTGSDLGPPPSPDEILDTLENGGRIPDVLRRRLVGDDEKS
jgi:hypothetical protein